MDRRSFEQVWSDLRELEHHAYTLTAEAAGRDGVRLEYRMYRVTAERLRTHPQISEAFANKAARMNLRWKGPRHQLGHEAREEKILRHVRSWEYLIAHSKATEKPAATFRSNISEWQNGTEDSAKEEGGGSRPKESKDSEAPEITMDPAKRADGPEAPAGAGENSQPELHQATAKARRK